MLVTYVTKEFLLVARLNRTHIFPNQGTDTGKILMVDFAVDAQFEKQDRENYMDKACPTVRTGLCGWVSYIFLWSVFHLVLELRWHLRRV